MIAAATQRNGFVEVWDENGNFLFQVFCDELQGFTAQTVTVRRGNSIEVFDEHGSFKFNRFV